MSWIPRRAAIPPRTLDRHSEDWGRPPTGFQRRLVQGVRAQDPGRLVVDASGWKQLDGTDLVDRHDYGDDL